MPDHKSLFSRWLNRNTSLFAWLLLLALNPLKITPIYASAGIPESWKAIARIEVNSLEPDIREPWAVGNAQSGSGTAWLVGKNQWITNAHVVRHATQIVLRLPSSGQLHPAKVVFIADDADLAVVQVLNPQPLAHLKPLTLGSPGQVPTLNSEVNVVGYPVGGQNLSVTRGVISRIEHHTYSHTGIDVHLAIQVDAAINPGNSGGPVLQAGKVVGVAFQGLHAIAAQNVGYIIPLPVLQRFLKDIEDGQYGHYVDMAFRHFAPENPSMRRALGLPDDGMGIVVSKVLRHGASAGILRSEDVILAIDGHPVRSNATVKIRGEWLDISEIAERKFQGDRLTLTLLRQGKRLQTSMTLTRFSQAVIRGAQYLPVTPYFLYAGLLFQPLSRNVIQAHDINHPLINYLFSETYENIPQGEAIILLTTLLPDSSTSLLGPYVPSVVDSINGVKIHRLQDIPAALETRLQGHEAFIVVQMLDGERPLVLDRYTSLLNHRAIQERYGIGRDQFFDTSP